MAKITDLTELAVAPDTNDILIIEDVSATTTKKIQVANLLKNLTSAASVQTVNNVTGSTGQTFADIASTSATFTTPAGGQTCLIWFNVGLNWTGTPSVQDCARMLLNGATVIQELRMDAPITNSRGTYSWVGSYTLPAGSNTVKLQQSCTTGSNGVYFANYLILPIN